MPAMRRLPLLLLMSSLCGCSAVDALLPDAASPRVEVPEMNVGFDFHEPLTLRASADEAMLSGKTTHMEVQSRAYGGQGAAAQPDGLGAWELPAEIAKAVHDERSCAPLKRAGVYLPVDTSSPVRCDLVLDRSGRTVVWMVGLGRPFESLVFMESSFIVLEEKRYHVFWHAYPFPEADATAQWLHDTFENRNPNMSTLIWPNKSYMLLDKEIRAAFAQQIEPPSEEVRDVMEKLQALAFSVAPSIPIEDQ